MVVHWAVAEQGRGACPMKVVLRAEAPKVGACNSRLSKESKQSILMRGVKQGPKDRRGHTVCSVVPTVKSGRDLRRGVEILGTCDVDTLEAAPTSRLFRCLPSSLR